MAYADTPVRAMGRPSPSSPVLPARRAGARPTSTRVAAGWPRSTPPAAGGSGSGSCRRWTSVPLPSRTTSSSRARTPDGSTPSIRRPARRSGQAGARRNQLVPGRGRRHAACRRRRRRVHQEPAVPADRLFAFGVDAEAEHLTALPRFRSSSPAPPASVRTGQDPVTGQEFRFNLSTNSSRSPARSRSCSRTSATSCTTSDQRQADAAHPTRPDRESHRQLHEDRQLPVPLHRARPCRRGNARCLHGTLSGCIEPARVARVPSAKPVTARFWAGRRARSKPWDHALAKRPCP